MENSELRNYFSDPSDRYYCWRALCEPAHYSLQCREEAKICRMQHRSQGSLLPARKRLCRMYDQKHAQSIGFLIIQGIHPWVRKSRKTHVDEIEIFLINFREQADYKRGECL